MRRAEKSIPSFDHLPAKFGRKIYETNGLPLPRNANGQSVIAIKEEATDATFAFVGSCVLLLTTDNLAAIYCRFSLRHLRWVELDLCAVQWQSPFRVTFGPLPFPR